MNVHPSVNRWRFVMKKLLTMTTPLGGPAGALCRARQSFSPVHYECFVVVRRHEFSDEPAGMLFPPLAKRFLFSAVRMPAVVKPVVENDDGPVLELRRDEVEDRFHGFVEVAVDVDDSGSL
jgi:hypothetical protein